MTIFADKSAGALTLPVPCPVRFQPGDVISVGGTMYTFVNESAASRDGTAIRVANLKKLHARWTKAKPVFVA